MILSIYHRYAEDVKSHLFFILALSRPLQQNSDSPSPSRRVPPRVVSTEADSVSPPCRGPPLSAFGSRRAWPRHEELQSVVRMIPGRLSGHRVPLPRTERRGEERRKRAVRTGRSYGGGSSRCKGSETGFSDSASQGRSNIPLSFLLLGLHRR